VDVPSRLIKSVKKHGIRTTLHFALKYLSTKFLQSIRSFQKQDNFDWMNSRRIFLGDVLREQVGHDRIIRGVFQGVLLPPEFSWSACDRVSMQLGFYECEVAEYLEKLSGPSKIIIDVGAADGYFAVSLVAKRMFSKAICFESSEKSRKILVENARQNNVSFKLDIRGHASRETIDGLIIEHASRLNEVVFLVDVEGGEVELFTSQVLEKLSRATLLIELHPVQLADEVLAEFKERCSINHEVSLILTGARNPSDAPELDCWLDNDRWNVCSEGRYRRGHWLLLEPKASY